MNISRPAALNVNAFTRLDTSRLCSARSRGFSFYDAARVSRRSTPSARTSRTGTRNITSADAARRREDSRDKTYRSDIRSRSRSSEIPPVAGFAGLDKVRTYVSGPICPARLATRMKRVGRFSRRARSSAYLSTATGDGC